MEFRLVGAPGNITGCIAADPQFTRVHTFTLKDGQAELTAPGGINTKMKLEKPGVYDGRVPVGRAARCMSSPTCATPSRSPSPTRISGCKWTAKKE